MRIIQNWKVLRTQLQKYGILFPGFNLLCFLFKINAHHVIKPGMNIWGLETDSKHR